MSCSVTNDAAEFHMGQAPANSSFRGMNANELSATKQTTVSSSSGGVSRPISSERQEL